MFCSFSKCGRNLHLKTFKSLSWNWNVCSQVSDASHEKNLKGCLMWTQVCRGSREMWKTSWTKRYSLVRDSLWCIKHLGNLMLKRFNIKGWTRIWKMMIISNIGISYSRKARPFLCNMLLVPWCTWNFKQIGIWVGAHAWARPMAISNSKEGLGAVQPGWITADPSIYI